MQRHNDLAERLVKAAVDRYAEGHPEPGDAQLVLDASLHEHQHALGDAVEQLTVAVTAFIEQQASNGTRGLRARAREAAPPLFGFGALAAAIAWVMDHFRPT